MKISALVTLLLLLWSTMPANAQSRDFWSGKSGEFLVKWSSADLQAQDANGKTVFSARALASANRDRYKKMAEAKKLSYEEDYELLSLVGPYLSFEYHYYANPLDEKGRAVSAHPAGATRYVTVDLRHPENLGQRLARLDEGSQTGAMPMAKLSDILAPADILAAMKNDTVIQSLVDPAKVKDLPDLVRVLNHKHLPEPDMCGEFDDSLLNEFCFHSLRGDKVVVRLGVSGSAQCRENICELGMVVACPESWKSAFKSASSGKGGVLNGPLKQSTRKARTHLVL